MFSISNALRKLWPEYFATKRCYSQCGEELILVSLLNGIGKQGPGTYVDIGAHHPIHGSNTYYFYRLGWKGVNIDPSPGIMELFKKARPRDINLEMGIGNKSGNIPFYMLDNHPGLNTFDAETLVKSGMMERVSKVLEVPVVPFSFVQKMHMQQFKEIVFVTIDTEGFELEVLQGFDFSLHRPSIIAVELNDVQTLEQTLQNDSDAYLRGKGYQAVAKNVISNTVATVFYLDQKHVC